MTPEDENARIKQLEDLIEAQRKALAALLLVIDEKNEDEIADAIRELLHLARITKSRDPAP